MADDKTPPRDEPSVTQNPKLDVKNIAQTFAKHGISAPSNPPSPPRSTGAEISNALREANRVGDTIKPYGRMENVPTPAQQANQPSPEPNKELQAAVAANPNKDYDVSPSEPIRPSNVEYTRPATEQGRAKGLSLGGEKGSIRPPPSANQSAPVTAAQPTGQALETSSAPKNPFRRDPAADSPAQQTAQVNQNNIVAAKTERDEKDDIGQDQVKDQAKEKEQDKNRVKDKDHER